MERTPLSQLFCGHRPLQLRTVAVIDMMASCRCLRTCSALCLAIVLLCSHLIGASTAATAGFNENFVVSWAPSNVKFLGSGEALQLLLDQSTGSGFASKDSYLFGNIDMQIKLVSGDSAGTVTAYYLSSETSKHDELDFEFLGNSSGQPYALQTNVFSNGVGGREQRIFLWFDPTADFHTYSVSWSKQRILFLVDGVPIRVFSNNAAAGVPYLSRQPMRVFSSIWNGDSWATRGGLVKINWAHAPFVATYRSFRAHACVATKSASACTGGAANHVTGTSGSNSLDMAKLQWVRKKFMIYNYCTDHARYPAAPAECTREF